MAQDQRGRGRRRVLAAIRKAGRIARVDLAKATDISQATVTTITAELIQKGLIEETVRDAAAEDMKRGRPRVALKVRGEAHVVAGMKLSDNALSAVLVDFANTLLAETQITLPRASFEAGHLATILADALDDLVTQAGMTREDVAAIGLGLPGVVDGRNGVVQWSPSLDRKGVDLRRIVSDHLGMPAFVDNDANLVAVAEQYYGRGRDAQDFLVVTVEQGVGMGIVQRNEVYRGQHGYGAEFGHTKVTLDGAPCRCGQKGCLEAYVADYALVREAAQVLALPDGMSHRDKLLRLIEAAKGGDAAAQGIIDHAGRMFVMGLANLVNIFDPELIIISGEQMQFDYLVNEAALQGIRQYVVQRDQQLPEIVINKWGDLMWARGAAVYAIDGVAGIALIEMSHNAA